jgi:hypothetical protein
MRARRAPRRADERAPAMISIGLTLRLRKLALEACVNPARFERTLSLAIDYVIVALEDTARR